MGKTISTNGVIKETTYPTLNITRTAEWVIAANDAPTLEKAQADVVCDGTEDDVEIRAAITAGYTDIRLTKGTFHTIRHADGYHILGATNLHLHGAGIDRTTIVCDNTSWVASDAWFYWNNDNIELDGFTLDLQAFSVASGETDFIGIRSITAKSYGSMHNVRFYYPAKYGAAFLGISHLHIYDCQFIGRDSEALAPQQILYIGGTYAATDVRVDNCFFQHWHMWAILNEVDTDGSTTGLSVTNCWFDGQLHVGSTGEAIYSQNISNFIDGNYFTDIQGPAIQVTNKPTTSNSKCIITNNRIYDAGKVGCASIYVGTTAAIADRVIIQGNTIESPTGWGIQIATVTGPLVANNIIKGCAGDGIRVTGCTDAQILHNTCDTNGWGIALRTTLSTRTRIHGNSLINNTGYGLLLEDLVHDYVWEEDNHYYNNTTGVRSIGASVTNYIAINNDDTTPCDNTAGGTNGLTTRPPSSDVLFDALALKAPSTNIALTALATQAAHTFLANITAGAASPTAATAIQAFALIQSIGWTTTGVGNDGDGLLNEAAEVVAFTTGPRKLGTVNLSTTINLEPDPGYSAVFYLLLTKSADATERTIAWHADTGLDHAGNWVNSDPLLTMGTTSGKRYMVVLHRLDAADRWLATKIDAGVLT